jgi:intracellular multiplication protein IcmC
MLTINTAKMLQNFIELGNIIQTAGILMGLALLMGAFFHFHRYGQTRTFMSHQVTIAKPLVMLIAAVSFLCLPFFIGTFMNTFWSTHTPIKYATSGSGWDPLVEPLLVFVRIIGVGSFMRGILLISRTGHYDQQGGKVMRALIHMIGGLLAVHVVGTKELLASILGM